MLAGEDPQATITNVKTVPSRKKLNFFTHSIPGDLTGLERGATIRLPASIVSDHSATSGDARCRRCTACTGLFLLVSLGAVRSEPGLSDAIKARRSRTARGALQLPLLPSLILRSVDWVALN
jgi:hypothetical protein